MTNGIPEPKTVASGYLAMATGTAVRQQHVQGCTGITGGTGVATITLDNVLDDFDTELLYAPISAPDGTVLLASKSGRTITFRAMADVVTPVLTNITLTFSVRKRGKLR